MLYNLYDLKNDSSHFLKWMSMYLALDTLSLYFFLEIYLLRNDGLTNYILNSYILHTEINFEEKYDETFFDWANCIVGSRKRKGTLF